MLGECFGSVSIIAKKFSGQSAVQYLHEIGSESQKDRPGEDRANIEASEFKQEERSSLRAE